MNWAVFCARHGVVRSLSFFDAVAGTVFANPRGEFAINPLVILTTPKTATPRNLCFCIPKAPVSEVNLGSPEPRVLLLVPRETQFFLGESDDRFRLLCADWLNITKSEKAVLAST